MESQPGQAGIHSQKQNLYPGTLHPFRYNALFTSQIRLLWLTSLDGIFEGTLEERDVSNPGVFYALSYTWADNASGPRCILRIGSGVLEIGDNLSAFFDALKGADADLSVPFWIDAICIDQKNQDEKIHQIPMMGSIYSAAMAVVVWLGPAEETVEHAIQGLRTINEELGKIPFDPATSHLSLNRSMPVCLIKNILGICSVLIRTWFQRLWTMQEYVLARDVYFMCGRTVLQDAVLRMFIHLYHGLNFEALEALHKPLTYAMFFGDTSITPAVEAFTDPQNNALIHLPKLHALRQARRDDVTKPDILSADLTVIVSTFEKKAKEPVDSVWGLLALLRHPSFSMIPVSKSSTVVEVFTAVTMATLLEPNDPHHLAMLHYVDTESSISGLPSWVPNFNTRRRVDVLCPFSQSVDYLYSACPFLDSTESREVGFESAPGSSQVSRMIIKALCIDEIVAVVPGRDFGLGEVIDLTMSGSEQLEWEKDCFELVSSHTKCHGPGQQTSMAGSQCNHCPILGLPESYIATLCAGSTISGKSRRRSNPTQRTYREFKWRISQIASPEFNTFFHRLHNPAHPGVKVNWSQFSGDGDKNAPLYIGSEKEEYHQRMFEVCHQRSFFITKAGRLGLGGCVQIGDEVVIFAGAKTPFVVRNGKNSGKSGTKTGPAISKLMGEAYVHGVMDGEVFQSGDGVETSMTEMIIA